MINNYQIFDRSIQTGDLELYKHVLPSLTNLSFIFNHQNYARYLALYLQNLQKVNETHPGLQVNIGVKRTNRLFSRQPVDLQWKLLTMSMLPDLRNTLVIQLPLVCGGLEVSLYIHKLYLMC